MVAFVLRASPPGEAAFNNVNDAAAAAAGDNDDDDAAAGYYYYNSFCYHPFEKSHVECRFWTRR